MSYYHSKEKAEPGSVDRKKVGPRDINDPLFDTDQRDKSYGEGSEPVENDPSIPRQYNSSENAGGSKSSSEKPDQ